MTVNATDLARAVRELRQAPADYSAWLEVAALLEALGYIADAEAAFAAIGEGARVDGRVALAIACGRHLCTLGSARGTELIERVIETYAANTPLTAPDPHAGATPPHRDPPHVELTDAGANALADARTAIAALGPWLVSRRAEHVPAAPLLSALPPAGARALIGVMSARAFAAGAAIVEAGAPASALYWLAQGNANVLRGKTLLGELHSGAFFGEIALVGGTTRTATVTARDDVWLLEIPALAVDALAQQHPQLGATIALYARTRLLANLVRTSELFAQLAPVDRDGLLAKFTSELVPAGTAFIRDGEPSHHLWVVVAGRCQVSSGDSALAELGPGAAVGELSPGASAVAVEPAVVLKLARAELDALAQQHPELLAAVRRLGAVREPANRALFEDATDLIV